MGRRSHTREVGRIGRSDLGDVENPSVLIAVDTNSLALSSGSLILIHSWSGSAVKIRPQLNPIHSEYVSALHFLVFDLLSVLAVGTSSGYLLIYSLAGRLIHRQILYTANILKFRLRQTTRDLTQDVSEDELCAVFPGSIARFHGSDIKSMLQRRFQENNSDYWVQASNNHDPEDSGNSFARLPYQLWNVSKYGACVDAAITGIMPPPLIQLQSGQRYYCAIAIGHDAVISAYRLSENRSRSIVGAILSRVVPATFSTISSFSKMIWRSKSTQQKKPEAKPQPFAQASSLTCLKDHPRKGEKLTLSPSGTLAAITDSLGRILLLDTQALVVVRLWKGYRDANCLFLEMLVNNSSASRPASYEHVKSDYCLCLAIHAPRKEIVEVWQMRTGLRLLTIPCPKGSKILQPTYRFSSSMESPSRYIPLEVFILNGDSGQILVLNRSLN